MKHPIARQYKLAAHSSRAWRSPIVPANALQAFDSAADIISVAKSEAQQLVEQAHEDARQIAFEAARDAQQQVWLSALAQWESFRRHFEEWIQASENHTLEAVQMALERLKLDCPEQDWIQSSVRLVLQEWRGSSDASLKVNPLDMESTKVLVEDVSQCQVVADPNMARGVCELHCGSMLLKADYCQNIDALVETLNP